MNSPFSNGSGRLGELPAALGLLATANIGGESIAESWPGGKARFPTSFSVVSEHRVERSGSTCQTRRIRSRHFLDGSLSGGGGETPGRCGTSSGGRPRWRTPGILLLYQL